MRTQELYSSCFIQDKHVNCVKLGVICLQEAHPVKLRQIHIINAVPLLDKMLAFIRPFMKSEVAAMVQACPISLNIHVRLQYSRYKSPVIARKDLHNLDV